MHLKTTQSNLDVFYHVPNKEGLSPRVLHLMLLFWASDQNSIHPFSNCVTQGGHGWGAIQLCGGQGVAQPWSWCAGGGAGMEAEDREDQSRHVKWGPGLIQLHSNDLGRAGSSRTELPLLLSHPLWSLQATCYDFMDQIWPVSWELSTCGVGIKSIHPWTRKHDF